MQLKNNDARKFAELIQQGIDSWVEAGKFAAKKIDEDPGFVDAVCDQFPHITPEMVLRFQQIGLRQIHPHLLLCDGPGPRRLRQLTYELQDKYSKEPVELLVKTGDDWETLKVDIRNLTPDQAIQVFSRTGINSHAAQRAILEDRAAKKIAAPVDVDMPYRITGRKVVVLNPCTFTATDLATMLAKITQ